MRTGRQRAFTLVELMVVIVLIGLLATFAGPKVLRFLTTGKKTIAQNQIRSFQEVIELFRIEKSRLPDTLDELTTESGEGEPFMEEIPNDPWDEPYIYDPRGGTTRPFIIFSKGEDRVEGTEDDITSERAPKEE